MTPLVGLLGVVGAYTLLVWFRLTLVGVATHLLAADLVERALASDNPARTTAPWIAGVGMAAAPVLLSAIHNGTSEAFNAGWAVLAIWAALRASVGGSWRWATAAGLLLLPASLASWYAGVVASSSWGASPSWAPARSPGASTSADGLVLVLGLAVTAPAAMLFQRGHGAHEPRRDQARPGTGRGPAPGPRGPGRLCARRRLPLPRSGRPPDTGELHPLPLPGVGAHPVRLALSRRRRTGRSGWPVARGCCCRSARCGPWRQPVILAGDRAVPLPYFVEGLPGFRRCP